MRFLLIPIIYLSVFNIIHAQQTSELVDFDFRFENDTISVVEPIVVKVTFQNKGEKPILVFSPFDVMKVLIKKEGEDKWVQGSYINKHLNIHQQEYKSGYYEEMEYHFSYPGRKVGKFILKIEYLPNEFFGKPQKIIIDKEFVVQKYYPLSEKSAVDWILSNESSYLLGVMRDITSVIPDLTEEEIINMASIFIRLYPKSKYISVFYYLKAANVSKQHRIERSFTHSINLEIKDLLLKAKETAYYSALEFAIKTELKHVNTRLNIYQPEKK